jgi:hypothetical protein
VTCLLGLESYDRGGFSGRSRAVNSELAFVGVEFPAASDRLEFRGAGRGVCIFDHAGILAPRGILSHVFSVSLVYRNFAESNYFFFRNYLFSPPEIRENQDARPSLFLSRNRLCRGPGRSGRRVCAGRGDSGQYTKHHEELAKSC